MNFSKAMFSVKVSNEPCPDAQALSDWAAGQITAERRETLTQHTAVCSLCAERVAALIRFSESPPAEEAPPESLKKKVRQRIPEDAKAPAWRRLLFHPRLWLALFLISWQALFL